MNFGTHWSIPPVVISQLSGSATPGETGYSLMCSTILVNPVPLPCNVPLPTFQWLFGPHGNAYGSLPSGVTPTATTSCTNSTGITYTSTLHFPRLNQHLHTGNYTCRIGAGRLANTFTIAVNGSYACMVTVNGIIINE